MEIEYTPGDKILIKAEIRSVYLSGGAPEYSVRVDGYREHEAYGLSIKEETIGGWDDGKRERI